VVCNHKREAVENVHARPRRQRSIEAMTESPDPVDQYRDEVLAFGGRSRVTGSRQRAITIIAAIAIAAGVVTGLLITRHHNHTAANQPTPPSSVGVQPATPVASSTTTSRLRTTLHGSPVTGPTGAQVLIIQHGGGSPPAWFTLDTRTLAPLDLPRNAEGYVIQAFPGGVLLRPNTTPLCDSCPGPPAPVYYAATGSRAVTRVGSANGDVAVTADHSAVWLSSYRLAAASYSSRSQTLTAQKVDLSGHALGPPIRLPSGFQLPGDPLGRLPQPPGRWILLARTNAAPAADRFALWNPSSRTATASFGSVIAVSTREIAWTALSCTEANCPLHLTDLTTGTTSTQPHPAGQMPTRGSYSPDGHHLALLLTAPPDSNAPGAVEIGLLDAAAHRLRVIPGTDLDIIPTLTWSADGRWLLITSLGKSQLGLVNPHAGRLHVATLPD
jgi:hypothetical protein